MQDNLDLSRLAGTPNNCGVKNAFKHFREKGQNIETHGNDRHNRPLTVAQNK
jgi:hypothetical protein